MTQAHPDPLPEPEIASPTAAPHPEEMMASADMRVGKFIAMRAAFRATPAGLIMAALLVAAILIPVAVISRGRKLPRG